MAWWWWLAIGACFGMSIGYLVGSWNQMRNCEVFHGYVRPKNR